MVDCQVGREGPPAPYRICPAIRIKKYSWGLWALGFKSWLRVFLGMVGKVFNVNP